MPNFISHDDSSWNNVNLIEISAIVLVRHVLFLCNKKQVVSYPQPQISMNMKEPAPAFQAACAKCQSFNQCLTADTKVIWSLEELVGYITFSIARSNNLPWHFTSYNHDNGTRNKKKESDIIVIFSKLHFQFTMAHPIIVSKCIGWLWL